MDPPSDERVPLTIGPNRDSQIYDPATKTWSEYRDLGEVGWMWSRCLVQLGDYVYHVDSMVRRLDVTQWVIEDVADVPDFLEGADRCSVALVYNRAGSYEEHQDT